MDFQPIIKQIYEQVRAGESRGRVATYIPELGNIPADKFGVYLETCDGKVSGTGDCQEKFSIQSIAKVFSLTLAYDQLGEKVWERVGVEPAGTPFNSLVQLEADKGIPRNPFVNAGALVICDILLDVLADPKADLLAYVRRLADNPTIEYDLSVAASEAATGYRNRALVNLIRAFGNIKHPTEQVLDLYFHKCSLAMSCQELAKAGMYLAKNGFSAAGTQILSESSAKRINAIMQTCGFYDEAGEFAYRVGLPGKSGVGGGILAVHPDRYSLTVWSPPLNEKGNSYRGMKFLERFTTETGTSIF